MDNISQYCPQISNNIPQMQNNIPEMGNTCPMPMMCAMCPLVYMMYAMGMNPHQYMMDKSLYLNPLIEE